MNTLFKNNCERKIRKYDRNIHKAMIDVVPQEIISKVNPQRENM